MDWVCSPKKCEDDRRKYYAHIDDCFIKKSNNLIGNFTFEGFKYAVTSMLLNSKKSIVIFIKNYNCIFNNELFLILKDRLQCNIEIILITYDGVNHTVLLHYLINLKILNIFLVK